jgi:UDPglucose 6-dehydrogenase
MRVGIVGVGNVGSALRHGFTRIGHEVFVYDTKLPETKIKDVLFADAVFVCVPTPQGADGSCDTSIVEKVVGELAEEKYRGLIALKSTVQPGTTDALQKRYPHLRLSFCPEFLRERAMYIDFVENHDVLVMGVYDPREAELLKEIHGALPKQYATLSPIEAEFAKYFCNVFNALRIVFANQFYDVCKAAGADYNKVKNAMVKHRNFQDVYLDCNENFRGFAGACLPKDTSAFASYARKVLGPSDLTLFDGIVEINHRYKPTLL